MPRDPNIPDAFDVYTLVLLRRPANAPEMPDEELDALQARHLAYRAGLRRQGILVVNGPLGEQSDIAMRGLSIFACDLAEARAPERRGSIGAGRTPRLRRHGVVGGGRHPRVPRGGSPGWIAKAHVRRLIPDARLGADAGAWDCPSR